MRETEKLVELKVFPGDWVVTNVNGYQHWSVASDRVCEQGKPYLISATQRLGTVEEETWDTVTGGCHTYVATSLSSLSPEERIRRARSQINIWVYSILSSNCEQFAKWCHGFKPTSEQVWAGSSGLVIGGTSASLLLRNPTIIKIAGVALVLAAIFVWLARAPVKKRGHC